jgi:chemosensory pili system protein ChpC
MSEAPRELYSLLIPLQQERLLLPRMCVAEVISFAEPERPNDRALPSWYLGRIDWNGRPLPVMSLESELPPSEGKRKRTRTRIVVLHALGASLRGGHYGILTQGFPQLVRVNPDVLGYEPDKAWADDASMLCRVRMIHEYPLIPDLEELERRIGELDAGA